MDEQQGEILIQGIRFVLFRQIQGQNITQIL